MADDASLRGSGGNDDSSSNSSKKRGRTGSNKSDATGLVSGLLQALVPESMSGGGSPRRASMGSSAENRALFKQRNLASNRSFEALKKKRITSDKPSSAPRLRDLRSRSNSNAAGKFESPDKSGYLMAKEPISLSSATATTTTTTTSSVDDRKTSKVDLSWTRQWFCLKGGTLYQFSSRDVRAQPVREIELQGTAVGEVIVPQHEFCLRIKTQSTLYLFQADSEFEYFTWIIALRGARLFMLYAPSSVSLLDKWNNAADDDDIMFFNSKTGQLERPDQGAQSSSSSSSPEQQQPASRTQSLGDAGSDDDEYEYEEVDDEVDSNASSRSTSPSPETSEAGSAAIVVESSSSSSVVSSGYSSASSSAPSSAASSAPSSPALVKPPRPPRLTPLLTTEIDITAARSLLNGNQDASGNDLEPTTTTTTATAAATISTPTTPTIAARVPLSALSEPAEASTGISLVPLHQSCPDVKEHELSHAAEPLVKEATLRAPSPGFSERGSASTSSVITAEERIRMMEQRRLAAEQRRKEAEQRRKEAQRRERSLRVHDEFSMLDSRSTPNLKNRFGDAASGDEHASVESGSDGGNASPMALYSASTSSLARPDSRSPSPKTDSPHQRSSSSSKLKDSVVSGSSSSGDLVASDGSNHHHHKRKSGSNNGNGGGSDQLRDSARDLVDPSNVNKRSSGSRDDRKRSVSMYGSSSSSLTKSDSATLASASSASLSDNNSNNSVAASLPSLSAAPSASHTASGTRGSRMIAAGPQALQELKRAQQEASNNAAAPSVSIVVDESPDTALPRRDSKKLARTGNFRQSLPGALKAQLFPKKEDAQLPRKSGILSLLEKKQKFGVIGSSKKRWVELRDGVLFVTRNATDKPLFVEQVVYCNARVGRSTRGMHTSKKKFCFELITPSCTRVFAADSGAEMLDWITKIQEAQAYFMNIQLGYDVKQEEAFRRKSGINGVMSLKGNSVCADCKSKKDVLWASINLGVFLCIDCAGVHRWLGVDHSQVRSITMDQWRDSVVDFMREVGNNRANAYWAANVPKPLTSDADSATRQAFITDKYVNRLFVDPNGVAPSYKGTPTHSLTHAESSENANAAASAADAAAASDNSTSSNNNTTTNNTNSSRNDV